MYDPNRPNISPENAAWMLSITIEEGLKNKKFGEHEQLITACHNVMLELADLVVRLRKDLLNCREKYAELEKYCRECEEIASHYM